MAAGKTTRQLLLTENDLPRDVERHDLERQPRLEHGCGALRIDVEVEFGYRSDVTWEGHGASHHDDARDFPERLGVALDGLRQVRERPESDDHQVLSQTISHLENQIRPVAHLKVVGNRRVTDTAIRVDEAVEIAESVIAVDVGGGDEGSLEGRGGPTGRPGHGGRLHDVENSEDVLDGLVHGYVAGDGGEGLYGRARRRERQEQGKGIVDARAGVEQERHLTGLA